MTTPDLGKLFDTFQSSAFRLETLPAYLIDTEAEALQLFLDGADEPTWRKDRPWLTTVRNAVAGGASMRRVRIVETPLTDYQRFQFSWGYVANEQAGEELSILDYWPPELARTLAFAEDFWLFDDEQVVVLEYDDEGRFLAPVAVDDIEPYQRARDLALASAVPFKEYKRAEELQSR